MLMWCACNLRWYYAAWTWLWL